MSQEESGGVSPGEIRNVREHTIDVTRHDCEDLYNRT